MAVLYQSDRVTVHHGDALDVLPSLDTESVDLVVTDPPYGVEWQSNRREQLFPTLAGDGADDRGPIAEALAECVRIVGQNRHLYVFGPTDVLDGLKVAEPASLVWDKGTPGGGDLSSPWAPAHEPLAFTVSKHRHGGKAGTGSNACRIRKGSVLRFTRKTGRKVSRHPTEKPTNLLRELIESSSRQGETVLDPFAGSGSTGVAAVLAGRRAVLVEVEEQYARLTVERVRLAELVADQAEEV